jgi:transcriptional regulator with XRE-family HTH domain
MLFSADVFVYPFFMKSTKSFKKILVNLGDKLAELRVKKGYETLKEFTVKYGLPQIQYWRIEKGKANITLKTLVKILAIHNLTLQDFFGLIIESEQKV